MCFIKKWIYKIFKLDKIMAEYEEYVKTYEALKNYYEVGQPIIESYKNDLVESHAEITELKEICADPRCNH